MSGKHAGRRLKADATASIQAPKLKYQPSLPRRLKRPIGLIGCGGISKVHLTAYKEMGLNVVALCDLIEQRAKDRRDEFFPQADIYTDYRKLLKRDDIEVVDIATHPQDRDYLIPAALQAGKHVLSQKPFVMNLDRGEQFIELAEKHGVKLAINQNGRWAPYVAYARQVVGRGLLGEVFAAHLACHWSHEWIANTVFNRVHHITLYDFGIHWFDMLACYMASRKPIRAFSTLTHAAGQKSRPPLLGQVLIEFEGGQGSLVFDGVTAYGSSETIDLVGEKGTLLGRGKVSEIRQLTLATAKGNAQADLEGQWFHDGFKGTMGELLCAIEQNRTPDNNAADNLRSMAICFAAVKSAESGRPELIGRVRRLNRKNCEVAPE